METLIRKILRGLLSTHGKVLFDYMDNLGGERPTYAMSQLIGTWVAPNRIEAVILRHAKTHMVRRQLEAHLLILIANGGRTPEEIAKEEQERQYRLQAVQDARAMQGVRAKPQQVSPFELLAGVDSAKYDHKTMTNGFGISEEKIRDAQNNTGL